ncbi:MAG TPA: dihydrodipicolinate synthase family protein [Blastocatellia bacterium]|nr:dihydrodipicolinate synthase family protein [Blastocatellia bacterium]
MQKGPLQGIFPPLTTPFDESGRLDLDALATNVAKYNQTSLAGYVPLGSNGEAVHLAASERYSVVKTVKAAAGPGKTIIGGVNELSARAAIEATKQVFDAGADFALVITPYFYKGSMSQQALTAFYVEVAGKAPGPILIYNIPQNTGVTIEPATIAALAAHENIVGVKDSAGDMGALSATLRLCPKGFSVMTGNGGILYPAVMMGASGGVLAIACLIPSLCVELYEAAYSAASGGDGKRARELQEKIAPISALVTATLGVAGLKAALDLAGYRGGSPRAPLMSAPQVDIERIKAAIGSSELFATANESV